MEEKTGYKVKYQIYPDKNFRTTLFKAKVLLIFKFLNYYIII